MASTQREPRGTTVNGSSNDRADALIAAYIEPHPGKPGIAEYRLRVEENGYPVWAIIGDLAPDGENIDEIVRDYQISREAVEAARAYYARHKQAIDDRLAANRAY